MKISTRIRYGTRLMVALAMNYGKGPVLLKDIAQLENISEKYLGQIIIPLKAAGLVVSFRGSKGGYSLNRKPIKITINDIARALEGDYNLVDCINDHSACDRIDTCITQDIWFTLEKNITKTLSGISLGDLVLKAHHKRKQILNYNI
ncbi:MAG: Rrf2 family transcriptional regulator [Candidatus Omnitrophica bacterium]|nr:Rrf2 family transcriptional regulator [Candidatus Omnitrophota bacterium]